MSNILGPTAGTILGWYTAADHMQRGNYGRAVVGSPIAGYTVFGDSAGTYQDESMGPAFLSGGTIVGANSARATIDEQFYRLTEAMGFTGFVTQQLAGGEGLFRDDLLASASDMTSFARKYHDMDMGDMMGIGEAMRRFRQVMTIENNWSDRLSDDIIDHDNRRYSALAWMLRARFLVNVDCWSESRGRPIKPGAIVAEVRARLERQGSRQS
jgi:hypothetical protein